MLIILMLVLCMGSNVFADEIKQGPVMNYTEETLTFMVDGKPQKALMRTPSRLCDEPALLIMLTSDKEASFTTWVVPDIFLAAGHRVVGIDIPCHGDLLDTHGEGIWGWGQAALAGVDKFEEGRKSGKALVDHFIDNKIVSGKAIVAYGVSRGGLIALHMMANDERIHAAAVQAPVTNLSALREFSGVDPKNAIVQKSNAEALIPKLANRQILIVVGASDPRISAENAFRFYGRLRASSTTVFPELFVGQGESHYEDETNVFKSWTGYHASAGYLLQVCSERLKLH